MEYHWIPSILFRFLIGQYVTIHGDVVSHVNITHVRVEDGGQYACAVSNRAGEARHAARLNVYGEYDRPQRRHQKKLSAILKTSRRSFVRSFQVPPTCIPWES